MNGTFAATEPIKQNQALVENGNFVKLKVLTGSLTAAPKRFKSTKTG
jgi:hypothetical protein